MSASATIEASARVTNPPQRGVPVHLTVFLHGQKRRFEGVGVDLSLAGLLIAGGCRLPEGQPVGVELHLGENETHYVNADVARLEPDRRVGLRFRELEQEARMAIVHHVARARARLQAEEHIAHQSAEIRTPRMDEGRVEKVDAFTTRTNTKVTLKTAAAAPRKRRGLRAMAFASAAAAVVACWLGMSGTFARNDGALLDRPVAADPAPAPARRAPALPPPPTRSTNGAPAERENAPSGRVAELLATGDTRFQAGNWSLPAGESALDAYRSALELEPGNAEAVRAVAEICEAYRLRAREVGSAGDVAGARWRLQRVLTILESDPAGMLLPDAAPLAAAVRRDLTALDR